jgi:hypothetical protein
MEENRPIIRKVQNEEDSDDKSSSSTQWSKAGLKIDTEREIRKRVVNDDDESVTRTFFFGEADAD